MTIYRKSLSQTNEDLREVIKKLREIDRWADSFKDNFPIEHADGDYWYCKIPKEARPKLSSATHFASQAYCVDALLRAANHLIASKPKALGNAVVTAMFTYPDTFSGEICVFFDRDSYERFFHSGDDMLDSRRVTNDSLVQKLNVPLSAKMNEVGYSAATNEEQWWLYQESVI